MTLENILDKIRQEHGLSALRDSNRLMGMFADYSKSQLRPQANALRNFLECRGNERILNLKDTLGLTQQTEYYRLVQEMVWDYNMQEAIATDVCASFWQVAIGTEPPVIQSKQTIQLQEPQPIQQLQQVQRPQQQSQHQQVQPQYTSPMFFTYEMNATGLTITGCKDKSVESCVIPSMIDGTPVTSIGAAAFFNCTNLSSIIIPYSVTSIGISAFSGCTSLSNIAIPNGVTSIGGHAFKNCIRLSSVTIPDSVSSIGAWGFSGCTSLSSVSISRNCIVWKNTFPDSCQVNDYNLKTIFDYNSKGTFEYDWKDTFDYERNGTGLTIKKFKNKTAMICVIPSTIDSIPITSIGSYAFADCTNLRSITIPNSVTSIGNSVFWDCSSLSNITIPNGVTRIGDCTFLGCSSLNSITIPNNVASIGYWAFDGCTSLRSVTINYNCNVQRTSFPPTCRVSYY